MTGDEDSALVARFLRGDDLAFDTLFARHQDYVFHIVYGIVGSFDESKDITQEVFVQVYRSLRGFRFGSRFATWLYRIAVNRAVDSARAAQRRRASSLCDQPELRLRPAEARTEPERAYADREAKQTVHSALMRCPLGHREVLALRYYQDLTLEEIAETLGCSVTAAKVRLHRARRTFKEHYLAVTGETGVPMEEGAHAAAAPR